MDKEEALLMLKDCIEIGYIDSSEMYGDDENFTALKIIVDEFEKTNDMIGIMAKFILQGDNFDNNINTYEQVIKYFEKEVE